MASETAAAAAVRLPDMNGGLKTSSDNDDDANNSDSTATGDKEMTKPTAKSQATTTADESASPASPSTSTSTKPESKKGPTATVSSSSSAAADAESEMVQQTSPKPPKQEKGEGVTSQSHPPATSNNDGGEGRRRNSSLDEFGTFEENVSVGSFDPPSSSLGDKQRSDSILSGPSMNSQQSLLSSSNKKGLPITSATETDSGEQPSSTVEVAKASSSSSSSSKQADGNGGQLKSDDDGRIRQSDDHNGDTSDLQQSSGGENNDATDAAAVSAPSAVAAKAAAAAAASVSEVTATEAIPSSSKPIPIVAPAPSVLLSQEYGRRPFRKRKGSVDFSFALDDNGSNTSSRRKRQNSNDDSNHSNSNSNRGSDFHHSMDALPPMGSLPDIEVSGDSAKDDHTVLSSTAAAAAASAGSTPASAIPPPPLSPLDSTQTLTGSASGIASTAGRTRSRTNSSAGVGSANTAAAESLLSMGSSSSKGSGDGHPDGNLKMAPPDAPMKDMSKNQRLHKNSATSHAARARKNSHANSTAGSNSTRRRFRAYSEDNFSQGSNSHETLTSQSHRFLLEAFMGDGTESLVLDPEQRERLGSFDGVSGVGESAGSGVVLSLPKSDTDETNRSTGLAAGAAAAAPAAGAAVASAVAATHDQAATNHTSRERFASIDYGRRERLESWGGMSDLSGHGLHDHHSDTLGSGTNNSSTAAALAATIYTSLANDVTAAADGNESISSFLVPDEKIPTRIAVNRDRMNSIASVATDPSALLHGTVGAGSGANADAEFPSEMQKYVKAAMASVGDQLAGIAASAEAVAGLSFHDGKDHQDESEISSNASPLLGDLGSKSGSLTGRPRSSSVSSLLNIAVDYDAVAAAVDAAEAAAGAVDLTNFTSTDVGASAPSRGGRRKRKGLPLNRKDIPSSNLLSSISELHGGDRHIDELRAEARAAAGYFPPSDTPHALPPKKRAKMYKESPDQIRSSSATAPTPTISNKKSSSKKKQTKSVAGSGGGQANQKWDSMLEALKEYAREREEEETKHMTEEQKAYWSWDGNVPTMYKTKDGKPLGRWVNNQRTAKSKGSLKEEREERLVAAGLKWTVQASSSWNEMLEELKVYIADKAKNGEDWDGNVPTNYCIKLTKNPCEDDEKNLGRWVNRQRSMFQAGKLRKDRQVALESVGLKWSVLTSITWDSMFDTLKEYVGEKKQNNGGIWDGNVPATYKTVKDDPPRALGRWINRQRSAYSKGKLKEEYVDKLNSIGLRWSIHDRKGKKPPPPPPSASSNPSIKSENNDDDEIVVEKTTNVFEAVNERVEQADRDGKTILIDHGTESGPLDKAAVREDVEVARSG